MTSFMLVYANEKEEWKFPQDIPTNKVLELVSKLVVHSSNIIIPISNTLITHTDDFPLNGYQAS